MIKQVEIINKGKVLRGTLHRQDKDVSPLVILYHGFVGYKDELHRIFVKTARALDDIGFASLRFDFAGSGGSDGDFSDMTLLTELSDAKAILDYALSLDFVDKNNISILGLSMGGAIASVLASERKEDIKKLCLWAPAGDIENIIKELISEVTNIDNYKNEDYIDYLGFSIGKEFLIQLESIDVFEMAKGYEGKVLIVHGENDSIAPIENAYKYKELYKNCELQIIKDSEHVFQNLNWEKQVIEKTLEFLKRKDS